MTRIIFVVALLGVVIAITASWVIGTELVAASPSHIPDALLDIPHESVTFSSGSGSEIHGWFVPGTGHGAVILMHGVHANRLSMLGRIHFLHSAGLSVLAFDFQAHGESPGEIITFGYREALDSRAAVAFMRNRLPSAALAAIGVSLGGAAALLGHEQLQVQALVLEAVYPTIGAAVANRLAIRLGEPGRLLAPFLLVQLPLRLNIQADELSPIHGIKTVACPLLIIAGALDPHTTLAESSRLYEAAPNPKSLWVIPGAAHVDFHSYSGADYEQRVLSFLSGSGILPRGDAQPAVPANKPRSARFAG